MRNLTDKQIARFWAKVDTTGGPDACWPWKASHKAAGYGQVVINYKIHGAHRVAYAIATGYTPTSDEYVCHRCDNPPCCNPKHLWLGSAKENTQDASIKGRAGRRLTPDRVDAIRDLYNQQHYTQQELADLFGVHYSMISLVVNRKRWQ